MQNGVSYTRLDSTGTERFQRLAGELGITSFGINLLRFHAGARGRIHKHATQEEVYLVLEGTLSLTIDGVERDLTKGEIARVGPEVRRQLVNRGPGRCVVLAMGGQNEHVGKDGTAFVSWDAKEGKPPLETPQPEDLPASELRRG
jgi:uncharacterized cupin superfamily protein